MPRAAPDRATANPRVPLLRWRLPGADISNRTFGLALLLVLAAAAIVRLHDLGNGLWFDEITTLVHYVRVPLADIISTFNSKNQHVFYSVLAHLSTGLFGDSTWALRLPAALFGVASIAALAWFGSLVTSRVEALAAATLLALSYHHVWFSQNARGYTGLMVATLIASALLVKMTTGARWRMSLAAAYGITMGVALYIHMTAALIIVGHAIWWCALVVSVREKPIWPAAWLPVVGIALAAFIALVLYLPVLPQLLPTLLAPSTGGDTTEWKNPLWFVAETTKGLARGLPGGWLTFGLAVTVALSGVVSYARRSPAIASLMLLPAIVTGAAIFLAGHNLWPRFFFFAAGFGALIVIRGVFAVARIIWPARANEVGLSTAAILIIASATTVPRAWNPKQDYLAALNFVERTSRPGDAIVTVDMTTIPFSNYYGRQWLFAHRRDQLTAIEATHARTFVLLTFTLRVAAIHPDLWDHVQRNYRKAAEFPGTVAGGEIIVMEK